MKSRSRNVWDAFVTAVARALQQLYPGIGRYDRVVFARVVDVIQNPGEVTSYMKPWSVDLEVLTPELEPDTRFPILKSVPVDPTDLNSKGQALFPTPFPGLVVRLGWMYGNRAYPFVHSFTAEGLLIPDATNGELSGLLYEAIDLLRKPRATAVGPGPYKPNIELEIQLLLQRIPR